MKLTLRRVVTAGSCTIEDEIYLEDDAPPMAQYTTSEDLPVKGCDLPPDTIGGFIRPITPSQVSVSFPLIEMLCSEIFDAKLEE